MAGVDWVVLMEDGRIAEQGTYQELLLKGPKFKALLESAGSMEGDDANDTHASSSSTNKPDTHKPENATPQANGDASAPQKDKVSAKKGTTLVQKEDRETGMVSFAVVWRYVKAMGGAPALLVLMVLYVGTELARLGSSGWISVWTGSADGTAGPFAGRGALFFCEVYAGICLFQVFLTFCNQFWLVCSLFCDSLNITYLPCTSTSMCC